MRLQEKIALISGGARGMGAVEARLFAKEGAKVTIGDVLEDEGRKLEAEINATGGEALFVRLDVTHEADWQKAVEATVNRFGKLDVLVNNAIVTEWKTVDACDAQRALQTMRVGFDGMVLTIKSVLPVMQQQRGHIINIGSSAGEMPVGGAPAAYVACKAAVNTYTQSLSAEMIGTNVRVTLIRPGVVAGTDFYRKNPNVANFLPRLVDFVPDVTPPDVANAVIKAIKKGKSSVVDIPRFLPLFYLVFRLSPGLTTRLLRIGGKTKQDYGEVEWSYR